MKHVFLMLTILVASLAVKGQSCVAKDPALNKKILIGEQTDEALRSPVFVKDWARAYHLAKPHAKTIRQIKRMLKQQDDIAIHVYFGSWCGDSKAYLPRFARIHDKVHFPKVIYYGLDRNMQMPQMPAAAHIERVPTFVVYKAGQEIGRIIEHPKQNIEADLLQILKIK